MRTIINDDAKVQVQLDENGREFHYEKRFIPKGDGTTEYSLDLYCVKSAIHKILEKSFAQVTDNKKHYILIQWPGVR